MGPSKRAKPNPKKGAALKRPRPQDQQPPKPKQRSKRKHAASSKAKQAQNLEHEEPQPQAQPQAQLRPHKQRSKKVAAVSSRSKPTALATAGAQKRVRMAKPTDSGLLSSSDEDEDEEDDKNEDKDESSTTLDQRDEQSLNDLPDAYISTSATVVSDADTESDGEADQSANKDAQHEMRPAAQNVPAVPAPPPLEGDPFQRARASLHAAAETHGLSLVLRTGERRSLRRWLAMRVIANTRAVSPTASEAQLAPMCAQYPQASFNA